MDILTERLILELQLQDLSEMPLFRKGKEPALADGEECPWTLYQQELTAVADSLRLAASLQTAVLTDAALIGELSAANITAESDRRLALRMVGRRDDGGPSFRPMAVFDSEPAPDEDELVEQLANSLHLYGLLPVDAPKGEASGSGLTQAIAAQKLRSHRCAICMEPTSPANGILLACGDVYDLDCLRDLVARSTIDASLMPPRCCRIEIPDETIQAALTLAAYAAFQTKRVEFRTVNPTYCSIETCSAFLVPGVDIPPGSDTGRCPRCKTGVCVHCKKAAHGDGDCLSDSTVTALRDLEREMGWQRCYKCNRTIELGTGCNHITCRCRAEFCYVCGLPWKTCPCPLWDETRIVNQAEQHVMAELPHIPAAVRARRIRAEVAHLRAHHECEHSGWKYQRMSGQCQECTHHLDQYLFRCSGCHMLACNRCRRNRL
ncbi:hypothetical protein DFJ77DRAFT_338660 [Powellomyces hirtus]|nr:hypothetical protein DFJ77DRAFT_338660 [Powellomyces hirtus]